MPAEAAEPVYAVPLPGRATDLAADADQLYAVSIDSSALTIVDSRTRRLARRRFRFCHSPGGRPPVGGGSVWVADGRRGLMVRIGPGLRARRGPRHMAAGFQEREAVGLSRFDPTAVAVAAGDALGDGGSRRLIRSDPSGAVTSRCTFD